MSTLPCAACGFANRADALYCGRCGAQLGRSCPACGTVVSAGLAFCTVCGEALGAEAAPAPTEERKVVSVLFADLVGFTARAEGLDPEDVRALLAPYHALLREQLERFGGTVEKFIGDAVVALFGAPAAHEDDSERAVRAALAVRDAITDLNTADSSRDLHIRVGVTTGEAVIALDARPSAGEGMAAGDVVNTASRLQAAAPVDGVLVDEPTHRTTEDAIEYRAAGPVRLKGKAEPVAAWVAVAPRARLGVDIAFRGGAELVGRGEELDVLLDALARARRERAPQLVTLVGAPGIGKSRLLWELYAALEDSPTSELVVWKQGRSLPYGQGVSFWALGEIVKAQAGILEGDTAETASEKLARTAARLLPDRPQADWVRSHLEPLVGLGGSGGGPEAQAEAFAAWRRFFEAVAEQRPLVLVFEDVQWADDGLLDFVDHLVEWALGVPLLVVCTARHELLERRSTWGGGKRNAITLSLSPLSDEETALLLENLTGQGLRGDGARGALLAKAGGNPLYAEEYARMLREGGTPAELPLPESVHGVIAARLDTLAPEEKAVLQDASVIGKVFWVGALAAVAGLERTAAEERLLALERREFVRRERRSSVAGETAYVFRHELVREVAYGQLPRAHRAELHRLTAEWITSLAADRSEDIADLLAHHYGSALDFAHASGQQTETLAERARLALREAGERASALHAFPAAARFFDAALALWPTDDPERPQLLLRAARAHFHAGDAQGDRLAAAGEELLDAGDREGAAEAELLLGEFLWLRGKTEAAFERFRGATTLLEDEPPSHSKTASLSSLARFLMAGDESEAAIRVGFEAFRMAEDLGLDEFRASTLNSIGAARVTIGDLGGLVDLERSIAVAEEIGSPEVVRGYNNLASTVASLGELDRAAALYARGKRAAQRFGRPGALRWFAAERVYDLYWRGLWNEALDQAAEVVSGEGSADRQEAAARCARARILLARGEAAAARADVEAALEFSRGARDPQMLLPALALQARTLLAAGARDEAADLAAELLEAWDRASVSLPSFWTADVATVLLALGRGGDLLAWAARARTPTPWLEAAASLASGDALAAAHTYVRIGSLPDEAHARLLAAEALVSAGRRAEAEHELARALDFYRSVGASAYVRAGEDLLVPS